MNSECGWGHLSPMPAHGWAAGLHKLGPGPVQSCTFDFFFFFCLFAHLPTIAYPKRLGPRNGLSLA